MYFVSVQFSIFREHCGHLVWGREGWTVCFSRVGWFILYAILSVFLLFLLASEKHLHAQMTSYIIKSRTGEIQFKEQLGRVKRIWCLSPMRAAKVQASLRIRAVSPEPPLLAHTSNESRGTFRQKARSLAPLNGWACAVKIFHDAMLEDTNSLDAAQLYLQPWIVC